MVILAALDETEQARAVARNGYELARAFDDTLVALHVVPEDDFRAYKESLESTPVVEDYSITQQQESAAEVARRIVDGTVEDTDVDVEHRGRVGDVADTILAEADRVEPRYLVVGGRRRSPTAKALLGDTTQTVLLNATCPVVTEMLD